MEHWINNADLSAATVIGREKLPLAKKLNPIWWLKNDEEPLPPIDYLADQPKWLRVTAWYLRNPFQNAGKYVLGVYDRNYRVEGEAPVCATTWADVPGSTRTGFKVSWITLSDGGWFSLPFVSYTGTYVLWYVGWQWWGFFGVKFNVLKSPVQLV